ncbi:hypothetical protein T05_16184 [Trichinella murrelli]|uniref:Uncharacterized protein n=1 Tax=Trichinella murrelli TaxID=144512 RepID=A0A0V0TBI8_9BILA|nr:hypothetical protein T05_16184 [Trichinella murrelli]
MACIQSGETVDHVSLYLTPFAFGAPTGGNAPCSNIGTLSTISSHYKIKKQDSCNGHVANPLQGETKWECTKCELSPCHQKGYLNNGIVEVPEETDCREVTVSPVANSESSHIIGQALDLKRWKWRRGLCEERTEKRRQNNSAISRYGTQRLKLHFKIWIFPQAKP